MDKTIKDSIEARHNAFINSYQITDENLKKEIDNLFMKMSKLGEECSDVMEFESKFATSPLSGEYMMLYRKMASTCEMVSLEQMFNPKAGKETKEQEETKEEEKKKDDEQDTSGKDEAVRKQIKEETENQLSSSLITKDEKNEEIDESFSKWLQK